MFTVRGGGGRIRNRKRGGKRRRREGKGEREEGKGEARVYEFFFFLRLF